MNEPRALTLVRGLAPCTSASVGDRLASGSLAKG